MDKERQLVPVRPQVGEAESVAALVVFRRGDQRLVDAAISDPGGTYELVVEAAMAQPASILSDKPPVLPQELVSGEQTSYAVAIKFFGETVKICTKKHLLVLGELPEGFEIYTKSYMKEHPKIGLEESCFACLVEIARKQGLSSQIARSAFDFTSLVFILNDRRSLQMPRAEGEKLRTIARALYLRFPPVDSVMGLSSPEAKVDIVGLTRTFAKIDSETLETLLKFHPDIAGLCYRNNGNISKSFEVLLGEDFLTTAEVYDSALEFMGHIENLVSTGQDGLFDPRTLDLVENLRIARKLFGNNDEIEEQIENLGILQSQLKVKRGIASYRLQQRVAAVVAAERVLKNLPEGSDARGFWESQQQRAISLICRSDCGRVLALIPGQVATGAIDFEKVGLSAKIEKGAVENSVLAFRVKSGAELRDSPDVPRADR